MKKLLSLLGVLFLLSACSFPSIENGKITPVKNPDPNHTHADFAIWIDGVQLDFSDPKYMSEAPVEPTETDATTSWNFFPSATAHEGVEHETLEEAADHENSRTYLHLHDGNGKVIHRHKPGLTFGDFLKSIGFELTANTLASALPTPGACLTDNLGHKTCSDQRKQWRMFVNGAETPVIPDYDFQDLDQILLTYGADEAQIDEQLDMLSADACLYSKTCPERGTPPEENCISDPDVPCVIEN